MRAYLIILLISLIGCSPGFHYKRIIKKDPSFFRVDTTTTIKVSEKPIKPYTVKFKPLPIDTLEFVDVRDSVRIRVLTHHDTIQVTAECPPEKTVEVYKNIPEPYPVYVKPTLWEKLKYGLIIAGSLFVLIFFVFIVFRLVRG